MDEKKSREADILYLDEDQMIEAGVLDAGRCVDVMEETMGLLSDGDCLMGGPNHDAHGLMLFFPKESPIPGFPLNDSADRRFIAMPAYLGGRFHKAGVKWYGSNGRNRSRGLPRSILMFMLNDVETGMPLAYMSANLLSAMRTGAMPGLAVRKLARPDSKVLSILGPGVIGKANFLAVMSQMKNIDTVLIKGSTPQSKTAHAFVDFVKAHAPQVKNIKVCATMEEAIRPADIVVEAISCKEGEWPEYKAEWFKPGVTFICTNAFNMNYRSIVDMRKVVDNLGMFVNYADEDEEGYDENGDREHTGCMGEDFVYMSRDGLLDLNTIDQLGDIVRGKKPGRKSDDEMVLVSIEGIPIEDVAWGTECYENALKKGIGTKLKMWDQPKAL